MFGRGRARRRLPVGSEREWSVRVGRSGGSGRDRGRRGTRSVAASATASRAMRTSVASSAGMAIRSRLPAAVSTVRRGRRRSRERVRRLRVVLARRRAVRTATSRARSRGGAALVPALPSLPGLGRRRLDPASDRALRGAIATDDPRAVGAVRPLRVGRRRVPCGSRACAARGARATRRRRTRGAADRRVASGPRRVPRYEHVREVGRPVVLGEVALRSTSSSAAPLATRTDVRSASGSDGCATRIRRPLAAKGASVVDAVDGRRKNCERGRDRRRQADVTASFLIFYLPPGMNLPAHRIRHEKSHCNVSMGNVLYC